MNPVNLGSVPANTCLVHATTGRVTRTIGRVPGTIGQVPQTVCHLPVTFDRSTGRLLWSIIHVSHLIEPNLIPGTCFTDGLNIWQSRKWSCWVLCFVCNNYKDCMWIQPSCTKSMNPVNSGSMPAIIGRVHATTSWVHAIFSRVPATVGWVLGIVGRVPLTGGRRRGEIAMEYHTCLTS
jgi:hypothetical protein